MTNLFLKAKHWQIAIPALFIPIIAYIILMATIINSLMDQTPPANFNTILFIFMISIYLSSGSAIYGWLFSVVNGLQKFIPNGVKTKSMFFNLFLFFPLIYLFLFFGFFFYEIENITNPEYGLTIAKMGLIIVPLHLFAMFCLFYIIVKAAKTIKTAETKQPVTFSSFAGEFFMIWFFPIGIWILQPRVNKLITQTPESDNHFDRKEE